jgi:hypothetical protein
VTAAPAPALVTLSGSDFSAPLPPNRGFIGRRLERQPGVVELRARAPHTVVLDFEVVAPAKEPRLLRIAGARGERFVRLRGHTRVQVAVRIPRGVSRLSLTVDAGRDGDAILVGPPRAFRADRAPELRAELLDSDPGF